MNKVAVFNHLSAPGQEVARLAARMKLGPIGWLATPRRNSASLSDLLPSGNRTLSRGAASAAIGPKPTLVTGEFHSYAVAMARVSGRSVLLAASLLSLPLWGRAQSPSVPPWPAATQACGPARGSQPPISWKDLAPNVLKDQKHIWLFPTELARGRHWIPTGGVVLATAGLAALDPHDTPYFRRTQTFTQFNRVLSFDNTLAGMALVPISAYALGLVRHDTYAQQTAELAAEALIDTAIPSLVIRDIARRLPPGSIPPNGKFDDSWFRSHR